MANYSGTSGDDSYWGGAEADHIEGLGGRDYLLGNSGDDAIFGGGGDDNLHGGEGDDLLEGGEGDDWLQGNEGVDILRGEAGNDRLLVFSYSGRTLAGTSVDGGEGVDTLQFDGLHLATPLVFSVADPAVAQDLGGASVVNVERLSFRGGSGNDDITGGALDDYVDGGEGNDRIDGGLGNDSLDGGGGNDTIHGGGGNDSIYGGSGGTANLLYGGEGDDTFRWNQDSLVDGGDGIDQLRMEYYGSAGVTVELLDPSLESTLLGTRVTGVERLWFYAGSGDDRLTGGVGNDLLNGNGGDDILAGGAGDDILSGGEGSDQLSGGGGDDVLHNVTFEAVNRTDTIDGGDGFDKLEFQVAGATAPVTIDLLAAAGTVVNVEQITFSGGSGINQVSGAAAADIFYGGASGDIFDGRGGDDWIRGAGGDDLIYGGGGNDFIDGGAGANRLEGGDGDDSLRADGTGANHMDGGAGDDAVEGGSGNDRLLAGTGVDQLIGNGGNDVLYFGSAYDPSDQGDGGDGRDALVLQGNVTAVLSGASLTGIESLSLQSGANSAFGDTANNFYDFDVTTADDLVAAGQQLIVNANSLRAREDFTFDGSAETDGKFLVYGGHGVDDLTGGDGVDVFFFEGQRWGPDDHVDGGDGRDALVISAGSGLTHIEFEADSFTNIESISVNNHFATDPSQKPSYELVLHNGNVAPGGTLIVNGSSIPLGQVVNIDGRGVHDGNLTLLGGGGHDTVYSGDGADLIIGGGGADGLAGGAGADTFRYDKASDSAVGLSDLIADFQTGVDKIDLVRIDANTLVGGDQAFSFIGASAFSGSAGQLRTYEEGGYRWVAGDTNGDGAADFAIAFQVGTAAPVQGDFLL